MNNLKEIPLGAEALKYIQEILKDGNTLGKLVSKLCDLNNGRILTFLPTNVSYEKANQFKIGGKLESDLDKAVRLSGGGVMVPKPNTDPWLIKIIQGFLSTDRHRLCIFEDKMMRSSYPCISLDDDRILILGEDIYWQLGKKADEKKIANTIRKADSVWHFLCIMSTVEKEICSKGQFITEDDLRIIAEGAEKIAVGAYDGEGYLIWSKV